MSHTVNVYSGINSELADRLRSLVAQVDAAADRADTSAANAGGSASAWFQGLIGDDSTASALRTTAKAAHTLADAVAGKVERLRTDGEAMDELRDAQANHWAENLGDIEELGQRLSLGGAASIIARDTAADALAGLGDVGANLFTAAKLVPFVALAVGAFFLWTVLRRARA